MKLIHGRLSNDILIKGIKLAIAPKETPPFAVEVMVFEEDTNLVLTVDPIKEYALEHPIRTMTDIMNATKHQLGTVVTNGNSWYAVVIDLDSEPICRQEWCEEALEKILQLVKKTGVMSLALPILGTGHGNLQVELLLPGLIKKLSTGKIGVLKYIWLIAPCRDVKRVREIMNGIPS